MKIKSFLLFFILLTILSFTVISNVSNNKLIKQRIRPQSKISISFAITFQFKKKLNLNKIQTAFASSDWSSKLLNGEGRWEIIKSTDEMIELKGFYSQSCSGCRTPFKLGIQIYNDGLLVGYSYSYFASNYNYENEILFLNTFYKFMIDNDWLVLTLQQSKVFQYEELQLLKKIDEWELFTPHVGNWTFVFNQTSMLGGLPQDTLTLSLKPGYVFIDSDRKIDINGVYSEPNDFGNFARAFNEGPNIIRTKTNGLLYLMLVDSKLTYTDISKHRNIVLYEFSARIITDLW